MKNSDAMITWELAEQEAALRCIRHDYVNELAALRLLLAEGQTSRALSLLDGMLGKVSAVSFGEKLAGDAFLNILFRDTKQICAEKGIAFTCYAPVGCIPLSDVSVCDLYANLVNNAIEASAFVTAPFIDISLSVREKRSVFSVTNKYNPKASALGAAKTTSKADTENHGVGLYSAEKCISEYYGAKFQIEQDKEQCIVVASVIFPKA